jgi:DNA-binding MarR family transcriptional regulator
MFAFRKYLEHTRTMPAQRAASSRTATAVEHSGVDDVDAVLNACRSLVAISAWSVEAVADEVDLVQLRVLVVLSTRGASSLKDLAETAGLHLTRASRACDRLVGKKLLTRSDDPEDRRVLQLRITAAGEAVVLAVMNARRKAVAPVLAAMSATRRVELVRALRAFETASGDVGHGEVSSLAWTQ